MADIVVFTVEVKESDIQSVLEEHIKNELKYSLARIVAEEVHERVRDWGARAMSDAAERGVIEEIADRAWQSIKNDAGLGFLPSDDRSPVFNRAGLKEGK